MNNSKETSTVNKKESNEDAFEDSALFENFNSTFIDTTRHNQSNSNNDCDNSALNVSALCCDEEISGYDKLTGQNWIYPTNYPVRDYQMNIVQAALFKNTLVCLPTGLGKTFIAAVVMYNFYRWYPLGKIVFMAPTRPLVAQQIEACYNIVAIPPRDTIEMTGHMPVATRKTHWQTKRVFFATPQVINNDIKSGICPSDKLRCLVFDEAHRAKGNYTYCQIILTLTDLSLNTYRVLALSATPGNKVDDAIMVINNLHIAHLELRTESCIDVQRYSHKRNINVEIIKLGPELTSLQKEYVEIIDKYTRRLKQLNILPQNLGNLSKGRVVMLYKEFQSRDRRARHPQHSHIMRDFSVLISLYHGLELLVRHGSRVFLNFFDEHPEKSWIQNDDQLTVVLERLRDDLGVNPLGLDRSVLPDGTIPEIPKDLTFGHPKFDKLKEIMIRHFTDAQTKGEDTRAIVFCEYRESVNLVHCLLLQCRPLIRPQMFVGQGASGASGGTSQRAQARAVRAFREGGANALVSTCVAEEGLDVGAVDLCVCFDVATRSPVRLVQRCGRTGRARGGQVYILVTEGKEHQTLVDSMRQRDGLNAKILYSAAVRESLYAASPRMLPRDFVPQCRKMYLAVKPAGSDADKPKKGQKDLRAMLASSSAGKSGRAVAAHVTREEFDELYPDGYREVDVFAEPREFWALSKERIMELSTASTVESKLNLSSWLEEQRTPQATVTIGHSHDARLLTDLLQYSHAKRLEAPAQTQDLPNLPEFTVKPSTPVKSKTLAKPSTPVKGKSNKRKKPLKSPGKKDGDIRALFSTATKSTKNYTKLINDLGIQNTGGLTTQLISLLVDLSLENTNVTKTCYICSTVCNCKIIQNIRNMRKPVNVILTKSAPSFPDINLLDDIDVNLIAICNDSIADISFETDVKNVNNNNEKFKQIDTNEKRDTVDILDNFNEESQRVDTNNRRDTVDILDNFYEENQRVDTNNRRDTVDILDNSNEESKRVDTNNRRDTVDILDNFNKDIDTNTLTLTFKQIDTNERKDTNDILDNFEKALKQMNTNNRRDTVTLDNFDKKVNRNNKRETVDILDNLNKEIKQIDAKTAIDTVDIKILDKKPNDVDKDFDLGDIDDIFVASSPEDVSNKDANTKDLNTSNPKETLGFFGLDSIEDIFADSDDDNKETAKSNQDEIKFSTPHLSKTVASCEPNISVIAPVVTSPKSPSLLSGRCVKSPSASTSPILCSQMRKFSLSRKKPGDKTTPHSKRRLSASFEKAVPSTSKVDAFVDKKDTSKEKSMLTITQLVEMINDKNESSVSKISNGSNLQSSHIERSPSPILLTQRDKTLNTSRVKHTKNVPSQSMRAESLIILDSDSDSNDFTQEYEVESKKDNDKDSTPLEGNRSNKRKIDDDIITNSPYFAKKPKVTATDKPLTLQEKVLAALNCNKVEPTTHDKDKTVNFFTFSPILCSQKENISPAVNVYDKFDRNAHENPKLEMLQMFKHTKDTKSPKVQISKKKICFDDSDDDFINADTTTPKLRPTQSLQTQNYKSKGVRKVKRTAAQFIDDEADLSDEASGDELSDESVGSIIDFICDEAERPDLDRSVDMHAVYMKSVKSPVRGVFKIPALPKTFNDDILSQAVEEDTYVMDSFCVDSHIGLTQVNEVSELEIAEMVLEEKKKRRRRVEQLADDSSDLPRVRRRVKRRIESDSDSD